MSQINIAKEISEKHSDAEIIVYLDSLLTGVLQNYRTSLKQNQVEILWGNLGDITLAASLVREMKKKNDAIEAQKQSMV